MFSRTLVFSLIAICALVAIGGFALAAAEETFEGKIMLVGSEELVILGKDDAANKTFSVNGATKIMRDGKPAKMTDLQIGDIATVMAEQLETKLVAKNIIVISQK